jgi:hypothetical protein
MLEQALAELFEEQASENPPPTQASVFAAAQQGRARRRRRNAGLAAASPVLAVGAVLAIAFGGLIPSSGYRAHVSSPGARVSSPAVGAAAVQAPRLFSPLRPYVSPGWLPKGFSAAGFVGVFTRLEDSYIDIRVAAGVGLNVWSRGVCRLSSRSFTCGWPHDPGAPESTTPRAGIGRRIGEIAGRAAYWMFPSESGSGTSPRSHFPSRILTWQYAQGGWAVLSAPDLPDALRIARSLRFGTAAGPAAAFPFRLTGLPADWRVNQVFTRVDQGVRYAFLFGFSAGTVDTVADDLAPRQVMTVQIGPLHGASCGSYFHRASYRLQIINGHEALVLLRPQAWDTGAKSGLCTVSDGVLTSVITEGHATVSATDLLAHHIRFLGPDPAKWTTRPIG